MTSVGVMASSRPVAAAPAPTFGAAGGAGSGTSTAVSVDVPDGVVANSLIVIPVFTDGTASITALAPGFANAIDSPVAVTPGPGHRLYVLWKRATGTEVTTGSYAFSLSASTYYEAIAIRYDGVITTGDPWDIHNSTHWAQDDINKGTVTPPVSDTTAVANTLLVHACTDWAGGTWTPPAGFSMHWGLSGARVATISDKVQAAAGATGSITATCTGNDRRAAWLGALRAA